MTQEQLNQLKRTLELRIEQCEKDAQHYMLKGTDFMVDELHGQIKAYKVVLYDIEYTLENF